MDKEGGGCQQAQDNTKSNIINLIHLQSRWSWELLPFTHIWAIEHKIRMINKWEESL